MYPAERGEQLGRDPQKIGSSKSLVLKSFWVERTLWDLSLPVSLTPWDTPALFTPPLPLPQKANGRLGWEQRLRGKTPRVTNHHLTNHGRVAFNGGNGMAGWVHKDLCQPHVSLYRMDKRRPSSCSCCYGRPNLPNMCMTVQRPSQKAKQHRTFIQKSNKDRCPPSASPKVSQFHVTCSHA